MRSRLASALLAIVLVTSVLAGATGPALAQSSGFVGVPDSNITEDLPAGSSVDLSVSELRGSVMASQYADSLQVVITTPERASEYVNGSQVGSGDLALVFKDDSNHEGRTVAVPADAIRQAVGHLPKVVHGVHEDGSEWTSQVRAENGLLYFEIPKFSSNSVTFTGTVSISATPATDGSSFSYDLSGTDSVSDPVVNLTGVMNTATETASGSAVSVDHTPSISLAGNGEINGTNDPTLSVTANVVNTNYSAHTNEGDGSIDGDVTFVGDEDGSGDGKSNAEVEIEPDTSGQLTALRPNIGRTFGSDYSFTVDIYIVKEGVDQVYSEGTKVKDNWDPSWSTGNQTITLDSSYEVSAGTTYTVEFVTSRNDGDSENDVLQINYDDSATTEWFSAQTSGGTEYAAMYATIEKRVNNLNVTADTGESATLGDFSDGETKTTTLPLTTSTTSLDFSGVGSGTIDYTLRYEERTITTDPAIELNGVTKSHSGVLADRETTSLTFDKSVLQEGTNRLNVSVGDGTLSADAPDPVVDLEYSHEATTSISTEYFSNGLIERYNVTNTFSATQTDATLRVPFSSTVYRLAQLEWSINDGSWSSVPDSRYSWSNNTLVVELKDGDTDGDVDAGTMIEVRTEGRMVQVYNGQISVPEPTDPDAAQIDSKIQIESRSSEFSIGVGSDERLHYAYKESWDTVQDSSVVESGGTQRIYLPNADAGDTAWITTVPIEVVPQSGDARVRVTDPDGPTLKISGGPSAVGDDVKIRYYAVTDGTTYEAYSVSRERPLSKDTAENGVAVFTIDDSEETIRLQSADSSSGGGGGGSSSIGVGSWPQPQPGTTLQEIGVVVAWAALVVLLVAATGRSEVSGRRRWIIVGAVGIGSGLLSIEVLRPGTISKAIGSGLQEIVPLAGLAAIGITGYSIVSWWQARQKEAATPETTVDFNLGRFRK